MLFVTVALLLAAAGDQSEQVTEVPFRMAETAIVADVTVNGRKTSLMFDTGFGACVEVDSTMDIGKKTGTTGLQDFVGILEADTVKLKSLRIGAKDIPVTEDMEAILAPGDRFSTIGYNTHVDGILGMETLVGQVVEINFQRHMFIFHPKSMDISKRVPDNKRTFLLKMLPTGHNVIMLEAVASNAKRMTMALDTGNSFYTTTFTESLERIGAWEAGKKPKYAKESGVASGNVQSWSKKLTDMTIFGVPVPISYWDVIDMPSADAGFDGTVGFGFLSNFNIIFDLDRRRVWLENFTGKAGNDEPGDVGISCRSSREAGRLVVVSVAPDGPADKAGIKKGDQLLAIDGKDMPSVIGWRELRRRLEGPKGSKVKLDLSRDGQLIRVELERVSLIND